MEDIQNTVYRIKSNIQNLQIASKSLNDELKRSLNEINDLLKKMNENNKKILPQILEVRDEITEIQNMSNNCGITELKISLGLNKILD